MVTTIVLPVSRNEHLKRIFAQFEFMQCNRKDTNILVYVDGDLQLFEEARNLTVNSKFNQRRCIYRRKGMPNVGSIKRRRQRIADIHNELGEELENSDYVFLIEDDTLFPLNTLQRLLSLITFRNDVGLVSAIQLGRWGYPHIGAWVFDDIYNPTSIESVALDEGLKEVDATGLYCCLMKAEEYKQHRFKPYEDLLGPDVDLGIELRKRGLKNYIDYNLKCSHLTVNDSIEFSNQKIIQVMFTKEGDKWNQAVQIKV